MGYLLHETLKIWLVATVVILSYQIAFEHSSFTLTHDACYHEDRPILLAGDWK
jgi:hypothetical protein